MCTGFTLRHAPPRRPASYGRVERLHHHPFVPGGDRAVGNASATSASSVTIAGNRRGAATWSSTPGAPAAAVDEVLPVDVQDVEEEGLEQRRRAGRRPKLLIVSWNACGLPSSSTPIDSPSSTSARTGSARATATTPAAGR